jgi:major intracellular serine protease
MFKVFIILSLLSSISLARQISVLVIDTGVDLTHEEIRSHVNMANWNGNSDYTDFHGHGTHIAGLILKDTCPQVELTSCKYYELEQDGKSNIDKTVTCFKQALIKHFDFINYSSGGQEFSQKEHDTLAKIKNSLIVVAAGNDGHDLSMWHYYPASYLLPNEIAVGNLNGKVKNQSSNYNLEGMAWEQGTNILSTYQGGRYGIMTGTSQATAIHTNRLIRSMCEKK